ncbi:hypothetical protein [Variovorax soli]|uniref:Type III secretion system major needle protein, YscF/MxiH/PrgI family n=1 Tax=Variovorax soli TaxID=376815 RepID=A0ABU1NES4_9BURK|nr:hypothetical protein [Variovorax soli]MDR6536958.1 hypothetical protein [Variovorax soli]
MINTNLPIAPAPVSAAKPVTADADSLSGVSSLAHAVLVSGGIEERMGQTLRTMSDQNFDVSAADLLKLQSEHAELSVWTETVSGSIHALYAPLKEAANKIS